MTFLTRLLRPISRLRGDDGQAAVRPLWHRIVEIGREKAWYIAGSAEDTMPGRFDIITLVLSLVLLRMETDAALIAPSVRLTELFVTDMDGQLRQSGVGDLVVGKHMGKLMSVLGGRLGAYRDALAVDDDAPLIAAISRNMTLRPGAEPAPVARMARALAGQLAAAPAAALLAGEIRR
jgi:cytochrome b pre-mRNA-processing protein 3